MPTSLVADRNLLFGILAVQMDFVGQDSLIRAMHAWVLDKERPLGELLVQLGTLTPERRTLLEALVAEHLKQHHQDVSQSLAAISSVTSARDVLGQITDEDVQASLAGIRQNTSADSTQQVQAIISETQTAATPTISMDVKSLPGFRYQILRPYAKGGLGEVLVARDQELNREVALKQIQNERADDPDNQARFLIEAEITGGLEHPGIVPVYGLGHYDNGRPYYAMRFIQGDSLKEAIARYHDEPPSRDVFSGDASTPSTAQSIDGKGRLETERNLELRSLLGRFIDVCNAMAYAHSRGVLHRDLKPGNIMLGKFGETLVVDWGLAKPMSVKPSGETTERQLEPPSGSGSVQTLMGSAVGTPQYMSPEQAGGKLDQLGPASDVYSLGATLYCLLTGQAPFQGPDVGTVLKQVQEGDFPPPRKIDRRVPRSLQAVCLKAMARNPADRYRSPKELAEDLESWLADEPIAAYKESFTERATRWGRRHKPWITAGAILMLIAVFGLSISTILINTERHRTANALAETEESRRATEEALARAHSAEAARIESQVDALLKAQSESVPAILWGLQPVREKVRPLLQRELDRDNLSAAHAIRIYLALLPDRPELVEDLRLELLQADADDFAMIRAGLANHQHELRISLWKTLREPDAKQSTRFRAACALAQFDSENPHWEEVTGDVANWLVHQNPLVLGTWVEMLEPVREKLLPALARQFRESSTPEIRSVANTVIGRYAGDHVDMLVGLLLEADPQQFVSLISQLQSSREYVLEKCEATVKSVLTPKWDRPPSDLPNPEPRYAELIERSDGLITENLALVQTLPIAQMEALAAGLQPAGFRPVRFRPYRHRGEVFVAAIWHRDNQPWKLETSLGKESLLQRDEENRKAGFAPVDLAGYLVDDQDAPQSPQELIRYGAIWVRSEMKPE
ncbi:MAG: serine/threonine protein kinase, partial [Planctomycetaceae bacterium]|nr:serine/threonine protein kinase [Planctomycetaceae bacterium]